jgi:haloacetate dehalogenase
MMEGFARTEIKTSGATIVTVRGGKGPPLLLMHGNPFTHLSWHKFAPRLTQEFTVVATDLRGYGDSSKPPGGKNHENYSFRAMAQDQVEVMASLGFKKFMAAGHDRGARVLHRMCLDHPNVVERAAILDIIPQHHLFNHISKPWATFSWHWFFNIQPAPMPEKMMGADPDWFIEKKLAKTKQGLSFFDKEALEEYKRCFRNPETVHAICEDYRACATIDLEMDTKDFDTGNKIACPALILWGATGGVGRNHKPGPGEIWKSYANDIRGAKALPCGHYLSEEAPEETYAELRAFFAVR